MARKATSKPGSGTLQSYATIGIEADFSKEHAENLRRALHPDLQADYVLANSPFIDPSCSQ